MNEHPLRVLLIDDDEDDYFLTRDLLAEIDADRYSLDWASDYESGLDAVARRRHDVYLLDYRLGKRTGLELLREAAAGGCLGPTIFLTGQGEREVDLEAMRAGAADFLEKSGLDAALLERSIRYALVQAESQVELERRVAERTAELLHANEALRDREDRLREADRRKDEFLAVLAHELRNPLAPIRSGLEILKRACTDPKMEEVRRIMVRQTRQMTRLIDDLLDVSRITQGKLELRKEPVELAQLVENAVDATRPFVEERRHELDVTLPRKPVLLDADAARITQVLANLLHNAAKYTEPGGRISVTARILGQQVEIAVEDTGCGIPQAMLERVFEMFSQDDRTKDRGNTGLGIGLTLVRSLVELHGGRVAARSEGAGAGSRFTVHLPIAVASAASSSPGQSAPVAAPAAAQRRVLVVDDNKDAALGLAMVLELSGNEVQMAYDGNEAQQVASCFRPHVVLMDLGMPKCDGYDAARAIREQPWAEEMVLVALTGWGQEQDRTRSRRAGFDHHLVKPVEPSELDELLAEIGDRCTG